MHSIPLILSMISITKSSTITSNIIPKTLLPNRKMNNMRNKIHPHMRIVSQGMMIKFTDIVAKRTPMTNIRNILPKIPAKSKRSFPHRWLLLLTTKIKMEHIFKMGMRTLWVRKCPPNLIGRSSSRRTIIRTSLRVATDVSPPHHGRHAKTLQLIARFLMNLLYLIQLRIEMDQRYSTKQKNSSPLQVRAIPKGL
jgi:hypothetical protein